MDSRLAELFELLKAQGWNIGMSERPGTTGWWEFITEQATTHIGYLYEDGSVYLPEGPDVVAESEFHAARGAGRAWRLVRWEADR